MPPEALEYPAKAEEKGAENSKNYFSLTLVGEAVEYISYFILAFEEIGKNRFSCLTLFQTLFHSATVT